MNKIEMQRMFLNYLVRPDEMVAIRGLRLNNHGSYESTFKSINDAVDYGNRLEAGGSVKGVYFCINPLHDNYCGTFAKDADIKIRRTLFIDIDACRHPAPPLEGHKVSSNQQELDATIELGREIVSYLASHGITQEPIIAISGNGTHLFYSIEMQNDEASLDTLKFFLKHIGDVFNGEKGDIDMTIRNAARIAKLTGTMATKGEDGVEPGRNHRRAEVVSWPSTTPETWQADIVLNDKIEALADIARQEEVSSKRNKAADRKAKSRGGRTTNYTPRTSTTKEGKEMTTYINRNDFIISNASLWITEAYNHIDSPDDRNQWLGILTSVKAVLGEAGYAAFDSWCATSSHYDAATNRSTWESPAIAEDQATEATKLAWSFMKLGLDLDAIAANLGFELSKDNVMSIDEIRAAISADNSLTVRWAYSTRVGKYYPAGVWSKDLSERRIESLNPNIKSNAILAMFLSTAVVNGRFEVVMPFIMQGTDDIYFYNEDDGVWNKLDSGDIASQLQRLGGFTVTGKKDGRDVLFQVSDIRHLKTQVFAPIKEIMAVSTQRLAFNNTALIFDDSKIIERKAIPSDYFTHKMDMNYGLANATPEFNAILERLFEGDAERIECYLQWAGAAIFGATASLQLPLLLLVSETGGTGKSMLLKLMELIVGASETSPVQLSNLKDRGILINIANKKLVIDYDVNLDCMMDNVDVLKNLITGEGMEQRVIGGKKSINVRFNGAICAAANGNPSFKSYDSGLDRRLLIVPTTNKAISKTEVIRKYEEKLFQREGAAIVNKMVEAFRRLLANGGSLDIPSICDDAKEELRNEVDVVSGWLAENYEFNFEANLVRASDLYSQYAYWCESSGHPALSKGKFSKQMKHKARLIGEGLDSTMKGVAAFRVSVKRHIGF